MIQTRNLNIDPVWYSQSLGLDRQKSRPMGMVNWISAIRKEFPKVRIGYFNPTAKMIK
jgi:hypothetical protein